MILSDSQKHFQSFHYPSLWDYIIGLFCLLGDVLIYVIILLRASFLTLADGLSLESEWQEVSSGLRNNAVIWIFLILTLISNCSNPFFNYLKSVPDTSPACSTVLLLVGAFFTNSSHRLKLIIIIIIIIIVVVVVVILLLACFFLQLVVFYCC